MASRRSMICCGTTKAVRQPTLWMFGHEAWQRRDFLTMEGFFVGYMCITYVHTNFFLVFLRARSFLRSGLQSSLPGEPFSSLFFPRQSCAFSSRVMGYFLWRPLFQREGGRGTGVTGAGFIWAQKAAADGIWAFLSSSFLLTGGSSMDMMRLGSSEGRKEEHVQDAPICGDNTLLH